MDYQKILGQRIKNFRKRAGLSQFQLELEMNGSPGYLSRVENGETNPTKETIIKIAEVLKLNEREIEYLMGKLFYPASDEEIGIALAQVDSHFRKKGVLAYMIDDRKRMIDISDTFLKFLNFKSDMRKELYLKPFVEIISDVKYDVKSRLSEKHYFNIIKTYLEKFYVDAGFMVDDASFIRSVEAIKKDTLSNKVWSEILDRKPTLLQTVESRKIVFSHEGKEISLYYSIQPLLDNRRFEIIEYVPTNLLFRIFSKIL